MAVTIRQKYDGLKAFLMEGVFNLTTDEIRLCRKACADLLKALPRVTLDEEFEDDRRTMTAQIRIIQRQLEELQTPTFTAEVWVPAWSNLYQLALEHLGDALRWNELAELNDIDEPYLEEMTLLRMPVK
jgi:hypothetical protein